MTNMRAEEFELVTFGAGGRFSRHDIDRISAMLEVDDVERYSQLVQRWGEAGRNAASTTRNCETMSRCASS